MCVCVCAMQGIFNLGKNCSAKTINFFVSLTRNRYLDCILTEREKEKRKEHFRKRLLELKISVTAISNGVL